MKKKEIIISIILATLLTGASLAIKNSSSWFNYYGWPMYYLEETLICPSYRPHKPISVPACYATRKNIHFLKLFLNFLFWFGLVFIFWMLTKWARRNWGKSLHKF